MPQFRIHNANVDIIIEAENTEKALEKFFKEHPEEIRNAIFIKEKI